MIKYLWMFVLVALLLSVFMLTLFALFKTPPISKVTETQAKIEFIDIKDFDFHNECTEIGKKISYVINNGKACQANEDCVIGHHICSININKNSYQQLKQLQTQKRAIGYCGHTVASCRRLLTNPQPVCIENLCDLVSPVDLKNELLAEARKNKP